MPPFVLWGFRAPSKLMVKGLGTLEGEVIEILWGCRTATVRDVHRRLPRAVAYTTVMTTLDRLFRKGLVIRTRKGRAFEYSATTTREGLEDAVAADLVSGLLSGELMPPRPFLSNLVETVGNYDRRLLDELEQLIRTKRRRLQERDNAE